MGQQEAFELLQIWGFTFYAIAYLALFAIPLLAAKAARFVRRFGCASLAALWLAPDASLRGALGVPYHSRARANRPTRWKTIAVLAVANLAGLLLYRLRPALRLQRTSILLVNMVAMVCPVFSECYTI